ncbi:hypothetical protein DVH05_016990 [Phytophthora capsici]|nr:hypothetical protein DVH05_016990 [Phytophthora capsici]
MSEQQDKELELLTPPPRGSQSLKRPGLRSPTLLYSSDGRYVFQRQTHVLRVLHAKSGRVLHECVREGNRSPVTALAVHPHNGLQLLAAYKDGYILIWDFVEQKPLVELEVGSPVLWMASSRTSPSQLLLVVQVDAKTWRLVEFSLKLKKKGRTLFQNAKTPFKTAALQSYSSAQGEGEAASIGDYVVLASANKLVAMWLTPKNAEDSSPRNVKTHKIRHVRSVTCVAVSPTQREFSIGDEEGQIHRYLYQDESDKNSLFAAKMHWHPHAVHCLQYASDGQFLMSGGEECVLVSWHLESGRRAYLPRLPASVEVIAARQDGGVYAVALADNVLFQYNPVTREQEWEVRGLARAGNSAADALPTRQLVVDPVTNSLVLNGSSGAGVLQFYEPFSDRVLQTLLLSERNHIARTEDEKLPVLQASHTCFSARGNDLVTLHAPVTAKYGDLQALRFWTRRVDGSFFVNTSVDAPHGRSRVTSVTFSPSPNGDCVVTADDQGDFKVWEKRVADANSISWHCQSVVRFRDEPITAVSFARDGSLLAVAYGSKLTLWDVATHSLRRVITSADGEKITQVIFPGVNSPYVVMVTRVQLQVWSLLSLSLWWRYLVPRSCVVAEDALHERFLVWMNTLDHQTDKRNNLVLVFEAQSPVPTCVRVFDVGCKVWSAGFHPGTGDIVLLDIRGAVWRLDGPNARSADALRRKEAHIAAVAARNASKDGEQEAKALSSIYLAARGGGTSKKNGNKHAGPNGVAVNGSAASSLFDAPAHVLPSMTALYRSFMDTMLPKPHQVVENEREKKTSGDATKKKNKRKKKQTETEPNATENGEQRKRTKRQVEKELANTELQQKTYSKLLETFRNSKARRA